MQPGFVKEMFSSFIAWSTLAFCAAECPLFNGYYLILLKYNFYWKVMFQSFV